MWTHLLEDVQSGAFISTFCDPDDAADFSGQLGKFTPCFTDVFILGEQQNQPVLHSMLQFNCSSWLYLQHMVTLRAQHGRRHTRMLALRMQVLVTLWPSYSTAHGCTTSHDAQSQTSTACRAQAQYCRHWQSQLLALVCLFHCECLVLKVPGLEPSHRCYSAKTNCCCCAEAKGNEGHATMRVPCSALLPHLQDPLSLKASGTYIFSCWSDIRQTSTLQRTAGNELTLPAVGMPGSSSMGAWEHSPCHSHQAA